MNSISMVISGRGGLRHLFANYQSPRVIIDAILQGYSGIAESDVDAQVARLTLRPFTILGGDLSHPSAHEVVDGIRPGSLVVAHGGWRDLLRQVHGERLVPVQRTSFSSRQLDSNRLRALASYVPRGYEIRPIDAELASRLSHDVSPDLIIPEVFSSQWDFDRRGIGFCALSDGKIVSAATSSVICDGAVQVRVITRPEHRRIGLATILSSALIVHCLERGIDPHWDTENLHSVELAKKLGYTVDSVYEVDALISSRIAHVIAQSQTQEVQ